MSVMIGCNLKGGLANMMFQIAAIEYTAMKYNHAATYPNINKNLTDISIAYKNDNSSYYKQIFKNFHWQHNLFTHSQVLSFPFEYKEITQPIDNTLYDGFFQSEKYFNKDTEFVHQLFGPTDFIKNKLLDREYFKQYNTCSIHIRRNDYLLYPDIHNIQLINYYKQAMNIIDAEKYIIFSDDINWCKSQFIGDKFIFIENNPDYIDLFLMSSCDHNIIANSSFSWWGAYLNENVNKKIVAPIKWFANNNYNSIDIIPDLWFRI